MESQRSFLFIALMVVTYLLFTQWQQDNAPVIAQAAQTQITPAADSTGDFIPESTQSASPLVHKVAVSEKLITVTTDVFSLQINPRGGDVVHVDLLKFDTEQGNGIPFTLLQNGNYKYIAQSGLTGAQGLDRIIPGRPLYSVTSNAYELTGKQPLIIDLTFNAENGLNVIKRFTLNPASYAINVDYIINNQSNSSASVQMYGQLKQSTLSNNESSGLLPTYKGAAYSNSEDPYEKYDFEDIAEANLNITTKGGWVAMLQHYFVSAWVPNKTDVNQIYTSYSRNQDAVIGFKAPTVIIEPNSEGTTSAIFYVGPKDQDVLEKIEENLDLMENFFY